MSMDTKVAAPKRILYVITKAAWGGAQRYVFDMAVAAKHAGHKVTVVSGTEGPLLTRLAEAGIPTETIRTMKRDIGFLDEVRSFEALQEIVRRIKPDVIHGNSSKAGFLAALAGRLAGVRTIIFTAHGWAFNEQRPRWQKSIIFLFHYATVLLSTKTICVSNAIKEGAHGMPFVQRKLNVVHNGIAPFTLVPRTEARARLAPDLDPAATWLGTIAELHPTKGLDILVEAFAALVQTQPNTVLVLMGDGQEWGRLQKLVQIYDLADRVVLAGFVANAPTYLSALDVFVFPSRSEALGYALLEAGLATLPSVASCVGGIPEIITDGETGLLVPPSDAKALASRLETLLTDPEKQKRLGTALYTHVSEEFSIERMTKQTLRLY